MTRCREKQRGKRVLESNTPGVILLLAVLAAAITGCKRDRTVSPTSEKSATSQPTVTRPNSPPRPSKSELIAPTVRIETSAGTITLRLDGMAAPGTVRNFLDYANDGSYDNSLVHYVDAGKMIVAGGYKSDASPISARTPIRNEAHNGLKNTRGTIAMARDGSQIDSATSQFFINLSDAPQRDHTGESADQYGYCVFGQVVEGLEIADKISRSPTSNKGGDLVQTPETPVVVKSVRVVP